MAYSTEPDFLKRIQKQDFDILVKPDDDDTITAAEILAEAIETADDIIDSYLLNVVTTVPLDEPPKVITQCSVDIAIFNLHSRIQYESIPDWVKDRYDACISWLKDIASGKANLGLSTTEEEERIDKTTYGSAEVIMNRSTI